MRASITGLGVGWGGVIASYHESWTATGGTAGASIVNTLNKITPEFIFQFGKDGLCSIADTGSAGVKPTPAAVSDREYQVQSLGYPYVETMMVRWAFGFSSWVSGLVNDLQSL